MQSLAKRGTLPAGSQTRYCRREVRHLNHLLALLGVLGLSLAAIFFRLSAVAPATGAFFRALYSLPVLFWLARRRSLPPRIRWMALVGGLLFGVDLVSWHAAIERIGAGLATVMVNTQIAWVTLASWLLYRERPPLRMALALPLLLGGVALCAGLGDRAAYGANPLVGALFGLLGALAYSAYLLVHRRACRGDTLPVGQLRDSTAGIALTALLAGLTIDPGFSLVPTWPAHGWLVAVALVVQVGGWMALSTALPRLPAIEGSTILLMQPVGTLAWGALLFGESPSLRQGLGALSVLAGIAVVQFGAVLAAGRKPA